MLLEMYFKITILTALQELIKRVEKLLSETFSHWASHESPNSRRVSIHVSPSKALKGILGLFAEVTEDGIPVAISRICP